jgi:putative zinc finger/helix-turn-helix YgiT family protein
MVEEVYAQNIKSGRTSLAVENLVHWHCDTCDSIMTTASQFEANAEALRAAERKSPSYVSQAMLREFREKYSLSQREAGRLIGAGDAAFAKYEAGSRLSAPSAKLIRVALALPQVVRLLAEEEKIEVVVEAEEDWKGGKFRYLLPLRARFSSDCDNDSVFAIDERFVGNSAWKKPQVACL